MFAMDGQASADAAAKFWKASLHVSRWNVSQIVAAWPLATAVRLTGSRTVWKAMVASQQRRCARWRDCVDPHPRLHVSQASLDSVTMQ